MLGWLVAHALTEWLVEHQHDRGGHAIPHGLGEHDAGHVHGYLGAAILVAVVMTFASLLAVFLVCWRTDHSLDLRKAATNRRAVRLSSVCASAAFVVAELVECAAADGHVPPLVVVAVGVVVQALIGAGTSLLWRLCLRSVECLVRRLRGTGPQTVTKPGNVALPCTRTLVVRRTWTMVCAGRAPPVAGLHSVSVTV
jgi:hypothetical protein